MSSIRRKLLLIAALILAASAKSSGAIDLSAGQGPANSIWVMVFSIHGRVNYTVEGKPAPDLLRALGQVAEKDRTLTVLIALDWRVPIRQVLDVQRTASKAGFTNIRTYTFAEDKGPMSELILGASIPYPASGR